MGTIPRPLIKYLPHAEVWQEKLRAAGLPAKLMRATEGSAGYDLFSCDEIEVGPFLSKRIRTGISLALPPTFAALILPRSGLASKHLIRPANTPGLIDSDYRGEIEVALISDGYPHTIKPGDRIAQLVIIPVSLVELKEVDVLTESRRGAGGFGSTGK